ncbi:unnamed protein product [Owenia fusiformis]|uniref:Palmitoyltransferase n=1 Tax=Owenia fusiformis TaxID=6347 RepID=A0A8S4PLP5_OWEFU|nr:unnamed protein product [Owenia fusiformis]
MIMSILNIFRRPNAGWRLKLMAIGNIVAMVYFITMTGICVYLSLFEIVPLAYGKTPETVYKHYGFILFIFLNVLGNFLMTFTTDTTVQRMYNQRLTRKDTKLVEKLTDECAICSIKPPPRSHHCPLCDRCVLKRDHHCFFITTCIGYHNQKYFILYCFYMMLGTFYAVILINVHMTILYKVRIAGPLSFITLLPLTLVKYWTSNNVPLFLLFLVLMLYVSLFAGLFTAAVFYWQMTITIFGQTQHELWHGINKYGSKSMWKNFKDVFGSYWFISVVFPIPLPQEGAGVYRVKEKSSKDEESQASATTGDRVGRKPITHKKKILKKMN